MRITASDFTTRAGKRTCKYYKTCGSLENCKRCTSFEKEKKKMTLKPLICPNCGGAVNRERKICEYCGTQFQFEDGDEFGILRVEHYSSPVCNLAVESHIPNELIEFGDAEHIIGYAKREIAEQLVDKMLQGEMIEFRSEMDWKHCQQIICARLRVLSPSYRF